jgi:hypothetical protein
MVRQLSPVAQAVFNAFLGNAEDTKPEPDDMRENIAAALRAITDVNVGKRRLSRWKARGRCRP